MTNPADIDAIRQFVFSEMGLTYYQVREDELRQKIDKAFRHSGASDYRHYLGLLRSDGEAGSKAFDDLVSELTVGETHFFRDRPLFDAVSHVVLPAVIETNRRSRRLWIWSAGCATGEEVYTIAMILEHRFSHLLQGWDVRIVGTDINRIFLHRALQGLYTEWSFRGTPEHIKEDCFLRQGKSWRIRPQYKRHATFQYHNLVKTSFPSVFHNLFSFDIIFCRNVMIYFDAGTIQRLVGRFKQSLVKDGWLIVGHADHNIKHFASFTTVMQPGTSVYRNSAQPDPPAGPFATPPRMPVSPVPAKAPDRSAPPHNAVNPSVTGRPQRVAAAVPRRAPVQGPKAPCTAPARAETDGIGETGTVDLAACINRGDWERARVLCRDLVAARPLDAVVYLLAAFIAEQEGRTEDAVRELKKSLYLDPQFVIGHYHLGLLFQKRGDLKRAETRFINVIRLLDQYRDDEVFGMADGISAEELRQLSVFHLEVIHG
jgi:chemotaxis protein methyltransferase CheR